MSGTTAVGIHKKPLPTNVQGCARHNGDTMGNEAIKLPKLLQDEINKAIANGVKAELKKLQTGNDTVPAAEDELTEEKKAAYEMLRGLGFEKPEEAYERYYGNDELDMGGEE